MLARRLDQGATLVVDDNLAAVQLEAYLARKANLLDAGAWRSADIRTHDDWCAALFSTHFDHDRLLLSGAQSDALWRSVVAASSSGSALLDSGQIAAWAQDAWARLHAWQIDFRELRARDDDPGFHSFLSWAARFEQSLTQSGWIDKSALNAFLVENVHSANELPSGIVLADLRFETPALRNLSNSLNRLGCEIDTWTPDSVTRCVRSVRLEDAGEELSQAVAWARQKIDEMPKARVALIVPSNAENELRLARCFDEAADAGSASYVSTDGPALDRAPAIGAALNCLALFSRRADFQVFSRWIRSPFLGDGMEPRSTRCLAEAGVRADLVAQLSFATAYRSAGLDRQLRACVPMLCAAVDGVLDRLAQTSRYQSPTRWASLVQEILTVLGWPGVGARVPVPVLDAWRGALEALSGLTPVLGPVDYDRALAELRARLSRARLPVRLPLDGITVLSRLEHLGPGYDAAWVMGMSDRAWPRSAQPNPLLPYTLQAVQQMPFATPGDAAERCRALTGRLIARVPEIVLSYPRVENEFAAEASPLLRDIDAIDAGSLPAPGRLYAGGTAAGPIEHLDDPVPPFFAGAIAGGAGTLATQARCPLRAFIDSRLRARPLEKPDRGFGARQRGILVHRALELLFTSCPGKAQLAEQSVEQLDARIADCIERALRERIRGARRALSVHATLERDRLMPLLRELVSVDMARSDFVTEHVEAKLTTRIGGLNVGCRIDRIDRLADGAVAIIDYKTGTSATPADWFRARLVEPQLPLYLQVVDAKVDAVMIGSVRLGAVGYRGIWQQSDAFPGAPYKPRAGLSWSEQRARWREQIETLVAEYAAGDGRILVADQKYAEGPYAPLTRVYERAPPAASRPNRQRR